MFPISWSLWNLPIARLHDVDHSILRIVCESTPAEVTKIDYRPPGVAQSYVYRYTLSLTAGVSRHSLARFY